MTKKIYKQKLIWLSIKIMVNFYLRYLCFFDFCNNRKKKQMILIKLLKR